MASVASQLMEEVTAHAQSDSLEDVREICIDGTYFPNNLCISHYSIKYSSFSHYFSTQFPSRPAHPSSKFCWGGNQALAFAAVSYHCWMCQGRV